MWLSLVEHWHGVPGVAGSSPVIPIFLFTKENIFYAHHNKQGIQNDVHPVVFIIHSVKISVPNIILSRSSKSQTFK